MLFFKLFSFCFPRKSRFVCDIIKAPSTPLIVSWVYHIKKNQSESKVSRFQVPLLKREGDSACHVQLSALDNLPVIICLPLPYIVILFYGQVAKFEKSIRQAYS